MYVAMTRAKEKLHVSFYGMPSRFIAEIPEDCIKLIVMDGTADEAADETERGRTAAKRRPFSESDDFEENVIDI